MYIHEQPDWPHFTWHDKRLRVPLGQLRLRYGRLQGKLDALGFSPQTETTLASLTLDATRSAEIEGERLELEQVRSSVARRLGLEIPDPVPSSREVDAMVDLTLDAIRRCREPLTEERLLTWQTTLFPTGRSGLYRIRTGAWRDDAHGPMQVVSGGLGRERVHFQAPDAARLPEEMTRFLEWFETESDQDPILDAAIAHLWFVTLHPFDDGNGRIARALADLKLSRMDGGSVRFYSLSAAILAERKEYYRVLELTQAGSTEITMWLEWFLGCMDRSLEKAEESIGTVLRRHAFWLRHGSTSLNDRQRKLLTLLLDGLEGKLTTGRWAKIARCSSDTALRDIQALLESGILERDEGGGRSTGYRIVEVG
ncbi:MAG TPA: Fic family protein [Fibrobacteria bacterium]|nr:Fic family protein [Fibrobacteria bacterium]